MNLTNEQIREFFENPEKLKENFPDAFKSGIELGKWSEIIEEPKTTPMSFEPLESKVLNWAKDKGILDKATPMTQALKTLEEVNELLLAINSNNKGEIEDALGDILVTIIIGAELNGLKLTDCLQSAYLEIKDRKGKMVNGTFVKE